MKRWTAAQQTALDRLTQERAEAKKELLNDIDTLFARLLRANGWSDEARQIITNFLRDEGQATLDVLVRHFDPSPVIANVAPRPPMPVDPRPNQAFPAAPWTLRTEGDPSCD